MGGACFSIHALGPKDQLLVTSLTGRSVIDGPGIKVIPPLKIGKIRRVDILEPGEYCIVKTTTTGALRRIDGPSQMRLGPYDVVHKEKTKAITLEANEYIRLVDDITGKIRLETGEKLVYPGPTEKFLEAGKKKEELQLTQRQQYWCVLVKLETCACIRSTGCTFLQSMTTSLKFKS